MKNGWVVLIPSLILSLSAAFSWAADPVLGQIPNGYREGRAGAVYGAYSSVMNSVDSRQLQDEVSALENKVYGLHSLYSTTEKVEIAKLLYRAEVDALRTYLEIENSNSPSLSPFERKSLAYQMVRIYKNIRSQQEFLFEDMVRAIDIRFPGPSGLQFRAEINGERESSYEPNFRSDVHLTDQEQLAAYLKKRDEFLASGGSLSEIFTLNKAYYQNMGAYTRVEYVVLENNEIHVTEGEAGHVLLAGGKKVKSAGQILFLKNAKGQTDLIVVSNASGNYKPDLYSAELLAKRLAKETGTPMEKIIVTKGEPVSLQTVKIYLKAEGLSKEEIAQQTAPLKKIRVLNTALPTVGILFCSKIHAL